MIGQRWVDERFLPFERLSRATAGQTISVKFALDDFGKEF
jgi:hypothetical protein